VRGHAQTAPELTEVHHRVDGDDVEQVQGALGELAAGMGGTIGDAAHLGHVLRVVLAQEQCIGGEADGLPSVLWFVLVLQRGELGHVGDDLVGDQGSVLIAALVGLALDVHEYPSAVVIAEARAEPAHGLRGDQGRDVLDLFEAKIVEPRGAFGAAVHADMKTHPVTHRGGDEQRLDEVQTRVQGLVAPTAGE